jgi:two-component system response regulator GlrR
LDLAAEGLGQQDMHDMGPAARFLAGTAVTTRVTEALERVSATDARVVLYGEPGVGKTHAARYLHSLSLHRSHPIATVSVREKRALHKLSDPGFFASIAGGTLVLQGVDEAPAEVQALLVGLIEEMDAPQDGDRAPARVFSTGQRDLLEGVEAGTFRKDLYYLLDVFPLVLPPLRERTEEIPLFLEHFFRKHARGLELPPVPEGFLAEAMVYSWPGNLRELENLVVASLPARPGAPWGLPRVLPRRGGGSVGLPFYEAKRDFEQTYVRRLLVITFGNVTRAAELAGKARKDFYALMARNDIDPESFRSRPGP